MLTDHDLDDVLTRAELAEAQHADAFTTLPITPDDLIFLADELKRQRRLISQLRQVWLGEREPNQAVYQEAHDWVLQNWPTLATAIDALIGEA